MRITLTLDPKLPSYLRKDYFGETDCLRNIII